MRWGDNSNDPGRRRIRFPRSVKNKLFAAQQGRCAYCGQSHHPRYLRIDHKYPFSRGGSDDFDNLQICWRLVSATGLGSIPSTPTTPDCN